MVKRSMLLIIQLRVMVVNIWWLFPSYKIHEIPATMAVDAGLINQEFLDAERERLGPMYPMYYECDFYNSSSTWYKPEYFQYGDYGEDM